MTSPSSVPHLEALVSQVCGSDAVAYLRRKHTGGSNGGKGVTYEDLFAVVHAAEHMRNLCSSRKTVRLHSQAPMYFVDDLVVHQSGNSRTETCFQLKNSPNVAWGQGSKSIADDFEQQIAVSKQAGFSQPGVVLVTSDQNCAQSLSATIPTPLLGTAQVRWFPWEEPIHLLCQSFFSQLDAIAWLSKHEAPKFQDVSDVLKVLIGIWTVNGRTMEVEALAEEARQLSPAVVRPLLVDDQTLEQGLSKDFTQILQAIPGFSYRIVKGFFRWDVSFPNGSTQSGIFADDCLSESFKKFTEWVTTHQPATFDDIEEELL